MTAEPVTATGEMEAAEAPCLMLEHNFRHLPVVETTARSASSASATWRSGSEQLVSSPRRTVERSTQLPGVTP